MGPLCQTVGGPGRRRQSICLASLPAGPERFHLSVMKLDLVHFLFVYHAALNFLSMHKHEETVRKTKALLGGREGIHKDVILFYESYQVQNTEKILNVGETSSAQKIKKTAKRLWMKETMSNTSPKRFQSDFTPKTRAKASVGFWPCWETKVGTETRQPDFSKRCFEADAWNLCTFTSIRF